MLQLEISGGEFFNESTQEFITTKPQKLLLEHSLLSLSKWEAKWKKPFFNKGRKTPDEYLDYIKCMTINSNVDPLVYDNLSRDDFKKIMEIEGLSELAKDEIASLEKKLQSNLDYSLIHFEKDVKDLLATEILSRYYGQKGEIIYGLREDVDIKEAVEVLRSSNRYKEILSPEKK